MTIHFFTRADNELGLAEPLSQTPGWFYSEMEIQFIRDHWQTMTSRQIAEQLGRSRASVCTVASKKLKLKMSKEARFRALSNAMQSRKDAYTKAEKQYLRDNWQTMTAQEMGTVLGRTRGSIKSMGQKTMGLRKTRESHWAIMKRKGPNAVTFKKGNLPANTIFGDEMVIRIRHNKKRDTYTKYIRIGFAKWQEYQHYVWEAANGPVPKKMILTFINGDRMDVRLDNLKLITMAENARRNSGPIHLPDSYVASLMSVRQPEHRQEILKQPELLDLKRTEIQLKRAIKSHDDPKPAKAGRPAKNHDR